MSSHAERAVLEALAAQGAAEIAATAEAYTTAATSVAAAFAAQARGDMPAARRWLTMALDAVYAVTGECPDALSDLADVWEIDDPASHR